MSSRDYEESVGSFGKIEIRCLILSLMLTLAACGESPPEPGRPLFDDLHVPEVLIEQPRVALPPEEGANRFLSGWFPWVYEERVALGASAAGARLQLVQLEPRPRTLALDLVQADSPGSVRVTAAGRGLGSFPLTDPLEIPLPADLPLGLVVVEIVPTGSPAPPFDVLAAGIRPALAGGEVTQDGRDLVHSGPSRVELVQQVRPGAELDGELVLPRSPANGQSFRITLTAGKQEGEEEEIPITRFEWAPGWLERFRGARLFRLPAGLGGLVKITLEARGAGPPARWRDLRWVETESDEPATAAPAPRPPQIVVLYVMDALRADHLGPLGGPPDASPTWDRLAAEGFSFRAHRAVAPSTLPSTRALFGGRTQRVPEEWAAITAERPLLAEVFGQAGYRTGLFSGNAYVSAAYGLDRGFDHVANEVRFGPHPPNKEPGKDPSTFNDNAARVHRAAVGWLDTLAPGDRAFLYLHTIHPHNPYAPPPDLERRFTAGIDSSINASTETLLAIQDGHRATSPADRERLRALYAASLAYNDRELAKLMTALGARFADGEVLLILTSDHGEELFDHGGALHGYTLYGEMLHIPLTFWWPGRIVPGSSDRATGTLDLHATLLDLLDQKGARSDGRSLLPRLLGRGDGPGDDPEELHFAAAPSVRGGLFTVERAGLARYILAGRAARHWGMGRGPGRSHDPEVFFDLRADPGERTNRAGEGGLEEQWLRARLRAWIREADAVRAAIGPLAEPEPDPETRERLRSLGYLQ